MKGTVQSMILLYLGSASPVSLSIRDAVVTAGPSSNDERTFIMYPDSHFCTNETRSKAIPNATRLL
jgi:hypothetical protein